MTATPSLEAARDAHSRQLWTASFERFTAADREEALDPEDLVRLATAAFLTGRDEESENAWARAHQSFLDRSEIARAARCAFWHGFGLIDRGDYARGSGWFARARRLLEDAGLECAETGFLLLPIAIQQIEAGDPPAGLTTFRRALEIGERFADRDLVVTARHGCGRALIRLDRIEDGVALLDEAMAALEAGDVSPVISGFVYCSVIAACQEISDLRRAHEWTAALSRWCDAQPDLVPYRGQCLVRRAELLQLHGEWSHALEEATRACRRLASPPGHPAAGSAHYRRAELHRLRGEFDDAEASYREAGRWSGAPRPGPALLRLARGRTDAAAAMIRRLADETSEKGERSAILSAWVEIMLAAGDPDAAREGAAELEAIADSVGTKLARAIAAQSMGAVLLAGGEAGSALERLRTACSDWEALEAPYESARVRVLIGLACRALGDDEGAAIEMDAARSTFRSIGALPDLARLEHLERREPAPSPSPLTDREMEVLRFVATGRTNRSIAKALFISERTVERHVSNIFRKLAVSSRAEATAHAFRHGLT